jgi:hypothetical protein
MNDAPLSPLARRAAELRDHFHSPIDFGGYNTKPPHVQRRFQRRLRLLPIPADLSGKTVLDVGAWDGFLGEVRRHETSGTGRGRCQTWGEGEKRELGSLP